MELIKLENEEQFLKLTNEDFILVKWDNYFLKHSQNSNKIMSYKIQENKKDKKEIICKLPENHYFNWQRFLENKSSAEEVYLIKD